MLRELQIRRLRIRAGGDPAFGRQVGDEIVHALSERLDTVPEHAKPLGRVRVRAAQSASPRDVGASVAHAVVRRWE